MLSGEEIRKLALDLLRADHESDVIALLEERGLWQDRALWRLYGDKEGNFASAGNQQSVPEAALVEKIVNSVDARLMLECQKRGIDPEGEEAPQNIRDAVRSFIYDAGGTGSLVRWPNELRRDQAHSITVAVTGDKPTPGRKATNMCLTIADQGEGQTPNRLPQTILSLNEKNKQRIRFVQGKFNMGGSGVLRFCGERGLQLVISRRHPDLLGSAEGRNPEWGVTIVRREAPSGQTGEPVHSEFTYLAPIGADEQPRRGEVFSFPAETLPLMPSGPEAYSREIGWGTTIKLYEFDTAAGQSHIFMKGGLLFALERLLPEIALPVRLHECRDYKGKRGSYDTTLAGIVVRLEDSKEQPLEPGFPESFQLRSDGMEMTGRIYAFRKDASYYLKNEGVIFAVNGQAHGFLKRGFFSRPKAVGLQRLKDSLLVLVDCSSLSTVQREDLFMSSRDRLSNRPVRQRLESRLEALLRENKALKRLQQERRESEINAKLSEEKPLEDVLGRVMKSSPALKSLFLRGQRLPRPFKNAGTEDGDETGGPEPGKGKFVGRRHPTYFRIRGQTYGRLYRRNVELGRRCRIDFETDAESGYFKRPTDPGRFELEVVESGSPMSDPSYSIWAEDGFAHLHLELPPEAVAGDKLTLQTTVIDPTLFEPFVNVIEVSVIKKHSHRKGKPKRKQRTGGGKGKQSGMKGIALPKVIEVREGDERWKQHSFTGKTACHVIADPVEDNGSTRIERTFYINLDNTALKTEMKYSKQDPRLLEAKFKYGNILLGLGLVHQHEENGEKDTATDDTEQEDVEDRIRGFSEAVAPVLLPIIDELSGLDETDFESLAMRDDEAEQR